ncbi:HPr family phosphocarrier protein [Pseudoflavonifractor sp. MSJ-37]|uniref:HPr family phosphocarrier protein n=1 Tax=Pseudoflavonifractor sp. MSJ-37 TaxID=2841531 RepID=UPI001C128B53|nr:HPr family phosphocarrier protein [Pseudoflavonifractor sp. MSJ-37]MBU5435072.1 HPr family phosphocarrier protein [Pseudoflavonifractor sp. MSJ-37]
MKEYTYQVKNELGMHARPAGMFVKLAKQSQSVIEIQKGDKKVNVSRLLAVMGMGIRQGDTITLTVDGPDEEQVFPEVQKVCDEIL